MARAYHKYIKGSDKKICSKCGKEKFLTDFSIDKCDPLNISGRKSSCLTCNRVPPETRYPPKEKHKCYACGIEKKVIEFCKKGKGYGYLCKECRNKRNHNYYINETPETRLNRKRLTAEFVNRQNRNKIYASNKISYKAIYERDNGICHICNIPVDPNDVHFDHIIPISRGGEHTYDNVKVSHPKCNLKKGSKLLSEL